ncbi:hypothetical protein [Olleya sp. ITB9]|uniref:hypothetical protein n=1 Tax=Olleya sp. ITB9 TaxID=1715648 RepID=UPI0006CFD273|nr:hypothetical protein [Olleya sp. ITB9]
MINKKNITRVLPIALNGFRSFLSPIISIFFSYIVVHFFSKELWGNFVEYLLFILITSVIINWGNKTYLMRLFSQNPKEIIANWQMLFKARFPICLIIILIVPFLYGINTSILLIIWLLSAFVQNSFLSVIFYNRDYIEFIGIELTGFAILLLQLYFLKTNITLLILLQTYVIAMLIKAVITALLYFKYLRFKNIKINTKVLFLSFPFFLLGISGFLQSKIDVYAYSLITKGTPLGEYQIISGFFVFSQSIAMLLIFPYVKNIYRMSSKSILKIKKGFVIYGFLLNLLVVTFIYFSLLYFNIKLSLVQLIFGFIIGYPCYIYSLDILMLFKKHKESLVIKISAISLSINFVLSLTLLYFGYNFTGLLAANAIAQIFSLSCYIYLYNKKTTYINLS